MTTTLTAPEPAVFAADVLAFAAAHGVTGYLGPLYQLAKRCFGGGDVTVTREDDNEIVDLGWIVFSPAVGDWDVDRYMAARRIWSEAFLALCPPDVSGHFLLGVR